MQSILLQDDCARYWEASRQCQLPKCLQCVLQVGSCLFGKAFEFVYLSSSTRGPMRNKKEVQNSRTPRSDKVFPYWIPITASFLHFLNFQGIVVRRFQKGQARNIPVRFITKNLCHLNTKSKAWIRRRKSLLASYNGSASSP